MKINSETLFMAADIASKSKLCRGTLKTGDGAMCVLGCVLAAKARQTKKSFNSLERSLDADAGSESALNAAIRVATGENVQLHRTNDSKRFISQKDGSIKTDLLREWQVEKLTNLAWKAYERECNS